MRCEDDADRALTTPAIRERAAHLVNEALVNALKHSPARAARIELTVATGELLVSVAAPGTLVPALSAAGRLASMGDYVSIRQHGDDVVLSGRIRIGDGNIPISSSAGHTPVAD